MKSLKDFQKVKTKRVIPLGIEGLDIGIKDNRETPKLTVGVGIKVQEKLVNFYHDYFDLILIDGEINLVLTAKGERAVRVRTKKEPDYLDKTIKAFQETIREY